MYPKKVKFLADKNKSSLYKTGFRKSKIYNTVFDDEIVLDIFKEFGTVTVIDDNGDYHEIEKEDYEIEE